MVVERKRAYISSGEKTVTITGSLRAMKKDLKKENVRRKEGANTGESKGKFVQFIWPKKDGRGEKDQTIEEERRRRKIRVGNCGHIKKERARHVQHLRCEKEGGGGQISSGILAVERNAEKGGGGQ